MIVLFRCTKWRSIPNSNKISGSQYVLVISVHFELFFAFKILQAMICETGNFIYILLVVLMGQFEVSCRFCIVVSKHVK